MHYGVYAVGLQRPKPGVVPQPTPDPFGPTILCKRKIRYKFGVVPQDKSQLLNLPQRAKRLTSSGGRLEKNGKRHNNTSVQESALDVPPARCGIREAPSAQPLSSLAPCTVWINQIAFLGHNLSSISPTDPAIHRILSSS